MSTKQSTTQQFIEHLVTNGMGYKPRGIWDDEDLKNTQVGLQLALGYVEEYHGRIGGVNASPVLNEIIQKHVDSIKTPQEFINVYDQIYSRLRKEIKERRSKFSDVPPRIKITLECTPNLSAVE